MNPSTHDCGCGSACSLPKSSPYHRSLISGAMGGIAGSMIVGIILAVMSKLLSVASLIGSQSAVVGFLIILISGIIFGMVSGILLRCIPKCPMKTAMAAMGYGIVIWVIGSLITAPLLLHTPIFDFGPAVKSSLLWYIVYAEISFFISRMFTACVCDKH